MRLAEVNDDNKVFSYQDFMKLGVVKVKMSTDIFSGGSKKIGNWHHASRNKHQWEQVQDLLDLGWDVINGWTLTGRMFSGPDDRNGTSPQMEIVVLAKRSEGGSVAVYPSGHVEQRSSKAWKPTVDDFKKDMQR